MFQDKQLQKISDESKIIIDEYHLKLDKISNDIRSLERILQRSGLGFYEHKIGAGTTINFEDSRIRYKDTSINHKPLIECKAAIRLEMSKYLANFFKGCVDLLNQEIQNAVQY